MKRFKNYKLWILVSSILLVALMYVSYVAYIVPHIPHMGEIPYREAELREQVYKMEDDFLDLDDDKDGFLSIEEYYGLSKMHADMDTNKDGLLSMEEAKHMMTFAEVEAGAFEYGTDEEIIAFREAPGDQGPELEVYLDTYLMAKTEVTIAQYVMFLNSALEAGEVSVQLAPSSNTADKRFTRDVPMYIAFGAPGTRYEYEPYIYLCQASTLSHMANENTGILIPEHPYNQSWLNYHAESKSFYASPGMEDLPAAYLSFWGAMAFAEYYDLSLPTEAEWEKAAKGGFDYDYGTVDGTISGDNASFGCRNAMNLLGYDGIDTPEKFIGYRIDVGSFDANPYGIYDLAGSVWEWTLDSYMVESHKYLAENNFTRNPFIEVGDKTEQVEPEYYLGDYKVYHFNDTMSGGPTTKGLSHIGHVYRGGNYNYNEPLARTEFRIPSFEFLGNDHVGARFVIRPSTTEFNQTYE